MNGLRAAGTAWVLGLAALGTSGPASAQTVAGVCGHLPLPSELAGKQVVLAIPANKAETKPCSPGTVVAYTLVDGQQVFLAVSSNATVPAANAAVAQQDQAPPTPRAANLAQLTTAPDRDDPFTLQLAKAWNVGPKELLAEDRAKAVLGAANAANRRAEIKTAAEAGDAAAQWIYGLDLLDQATDSAGARRAAEWFAKSADQGFAPAQATLSDQIHKAQGVPFDRARMLDLMLSAASSGDAYAQINASYLLNGGYYVKEDFDAAKVIQARLAERGFEPAVILRLAERSKDANGAASAVELQRYADQGSGMAAYMLSRAYMNGTGVAKDKAAAARYADMAASRGHIEALSEAGLYYRSAKGADKDKVLGEQLYAKQFPYFLARATKGSAVAQLSLAYLYESGTGVAKDKTAAYNWMTSAYASGLPTARYSVATYKNSGYGGFSRDCSAGTAELRMLAQEGYADADNALGSDYIWGACNDKDQYMARQHYERAEKNGNTAQRFTARGNLDYFLKNKGYQPKQAGGGFLDAIAQAAPVVIGALNQASADLAAQRQADAAQQAQLNRQYQNAMQAAQQRQQQTNANLAAAAAARDARAASTDQARQEALRRQQVALAQARAVAAQRPAPSPAAAGTTPPAQRIVTATPAARPAAPAAEIITMMEGVVVCPLSSDRAKLFGESTCHGPFQSVVSDPSQPQGIAQACGSSTRPPRDLGMYGNNRVWGCNYGINPRKPGSPNVDQAQKFGLNIPSRQTYRCDAKIDGYCRGN